MLMTMPLWLMMTIMMLEIVGDNNIVNRSGKGNGFEMENK